MFSQFGHFIAYDTIIFPAVMQARPQVIPSQALRPASLIIISGEAKANDYRHLHNSEDREFK